MKLPTPEQLGMPSKYERWRPQQEEAITVSLTQRNLKKEIGLGSPTGSGKTGVNIALALLTKEPTCIVTESRGLQNQYMEEGQEIGMVDLRGKSNYECGMKEDYSCEEGANAKCPYQGSVRCPASKAEIQFGKTRLGITNYAKWTAGKRAASPYMSHFTQVIFDEAHVTPSALAQAMQIVLHHHEIEETLNFPFPDNYIPKRYDPEEMTGIMTQWKVWAETLKPICELEMRKAKSKIETVSSPKKSWVRHYMHLRELNRRLGILRLATPKNWVVDSFEGKDGDWGFLFDPIRPGRYTEALLHGGANHLVYTSASFHEKCFRLLGRGRDSYFYKEFDSTFDVKDCPIYYVPTAKIDSRSDEHDLAQQWMLLDRIASGRRDRKGGIHTISYTRVDEILKRSRFSPYMYVNERGEPPTRLIEDFSIAEPGSILVSPSWGTGYDFPLDMMEWQFIWKIPFDPPSKINQARDHDDKGEYRGYSAANKFAQMAGRINRQEGDRGETFIGDTNMKWFYPRFSKFLPKDVQNRMQRVDVVPPPLRKM